MTQKVAFLDHSLRVGLKSLLSNVLIAYKYIIWISSAVDFLHLFSR
jgi:hypothetical protein